MSGKLWFWLVIFIELFASCKAKDKSCGAKTASLSQGAKDLFSQKVGVVGGFLEYFEYAADQSLATTPWDQLKPEKISRCSAHFRFSEPSPGQFRVLVGTSAHCIRKIQSIGTEPRIRVFVADPNLGYGFELVEIEDLELLKRNRAFSQLGEVDPKIKETIHKNWLFDSNTNLFYNAFNTLEKAQRACVNPLTPEQMSTRVYPEALIPEPSTCPWFLETFHRSYAVKLPSNANEMVSLLKYLSGLEVQRIKSQAILAETGDLTKKWDAITSSFWDQVKLIQELKTMQAVAQTCLSSNDAACYSKMESGLRVFWGAVKQNIYLDVNFDKKIVGVNKNTIQDLLFTLSSALQKAETKLQRLALEFGTLQSQWNSTLFGNQIKVQIGGIFLDPEGTNPTSSTVGFSVVPARPDTPPHALMKGIEFNFIGARMNFVALSKVTKNFSQPWSQGTGIYYNLQPVLYFSPITEESGGTNVMELPPRRQKIDESATKSNKESAGGKKENSKDGC
jgi:hypothetical protein